MCFHCIIFLFPVYFIDWIYVNCLPFILICLEQMTIPIPYELLLWFHRRGQTNIKIFSKSIVWKYVQSVSWIMKCIWIKCNTFVKRMIFPFASQHALCIAFHFNVCFCGVMLHIYNVRCYNNNSIFLVLFIIIIIRKKCR